MISMSPSEAQMLQSFSSQIDGGRNGFSSSTSPTPPTSGAPIKHPVTARSRIKKNASKQQAFGDSHGSGIEGKARLRKACDLCSARKVKVGRFFSILNTYLTLGIQVTPVANNSKLA